MLGILLLGATALALFAAIGVSTVDQNGLTAFDQWFSEVLHKHAKETPAAVGLFRALTTLGSQPALVALAVAVALALALRGRRWLSRGWLLTVCGGLLYMPLKQLFPRSRPQFDDPFVIEPSLSFPSGHSMAALIAYGLLAYLAVLVIPSRAVRAAAVIGSAVLVLAIGFSRLYLGAHYFSDVIGGYAAGAFWLSVSVSGFEAARRYRSETIQGPGSAL